MTYVTHIISHFTYIKRTLLTQTLGHFPRPQCIFQYMLTFDIFNTLKTKINKRFSSHRAVNTIRFGARFAKKKSENRLLALTMSPYVRLYDTTRLPLERFSWNFISSIFYFLLNMSKKIQVSLNSDQNKEHLTCIYIHL